MEEKRGGLSQWRKKHWAKKKLLFQKPFSIILSGSKLVPAVISAVAEENPGALVRDHCGGVATYFSVCWALVGGERRGITSTHARRSAMFSTFSLQEGTTFGISMCKKSIRRLPMFLNQLPQ